MTIDARTETRIEPVRALTLERLRQRTSEKWREYDDDVIPMFVAETDFPLAPAITAALHHAIELGDTGYTASRNPLAATFAAFAARRYGWAVDPARVRSTACRASISSPSEAAPGSSSTLSTFRIRSATAMAQDYLSVRPISTLDRTSVRYVLNDVQGLSMGRTSP